MFITEIKELVDNYEGKKSHFLLKLDNEAVHLKCDDAAEKERWVQAISKLRAIYQGKKVFDFEDDRKSHKDEIDIRILNTIMDEQEGTFDSADEFAKEIASKQNFDRILKAKGVKSYFDLVSPKILKNHIVFGWTKKTSGSLG